MYTILGNWCDKPPERLNLLWPLINKLCLTNRLLALAQVPQKRNVKAQNKCIDKILTAITLGHDFGKSRLFLNF